MNTKQCEIRKFGPYHCRRKGTVLMDDVGLKEGVKVRLCEKCAAMVRERTKQTVMGSTVSPS